jgi:ectoine hydroxylase-related dioxygenase (phytanoyl-CoA dioxygenase family)
MVLPREIDLGDGGGDRPFCTMSDHQPRQGETKSLTPSQHAENFRSEGFSVVPGVFSEAEVAEIRAAIEEAAGRMPGAGPSTKGAMVFHTNCYRFSERLQELCADPRLVELVRPLAGDDYWIRWDQCVAKGPGAPVFPWHQDNAYNGLKDEHFQVWIALSEMTELNGGVRFAPGSHRAGRLPHTRNGAHHVVDQEPTNGLLVKAKPGDVVLFSSLLLHQTGENESEEPRWAYVLEFMKAKHFDPVSKLPYFMVVEKGRPSLRWTTWYKGRVHPANAVKYLSWRLKNAAKALRG